VTEDAATRLIENEVSQRFVFRDPAGLFPDGCPRRRCNATDDNIADFPFGMAADDMNKLG
jgi:hypothetical protein